MIKYSQTNERRYLPLSRQRTWQLWDLRSLNVLVLVATVAMFVGYLAMNNQAAANGFTIKSIEKKIADLEERKRQLDLDVLGRQSMSNVESQVKGLGYVPVENVDFLTAVGGAVAVK